MHFAVRHCKLNRNLERRGICSVPFLTFGNGVVRLCGVELIIHKIQYEVAGEVSYSRNVLKNLPESLVKKPLVGVLLNFDKVRHFQNLVNVGKAHSFCLAETNGFDIYHTITPFKNLLLEKASVFMRIAAP